MYRKIGSFFIRFVMFTITLVYSGVWKQSVTRKYWMQNFCQSIVYFIGDSSWIDENKQATTDRVLAYHVNTKVTHVDFLINVIHKHHLRKYIKLIDTDTHLKLANWNPNPSGGKTLWDLVYCTIGIWLYSQIGSNHYHMIHLKEFHKYPMNYQRYPIAPYMPSLPDSDQVHCSGWSSSHKTKIHTENKSNHLTQYSFLANQ